MDFAAYHTGLWVFSPKFKEACIDQLTFLPGVLQMIRSKHNEISFLVTKSNLRRWFVTPVFHGLQCPSTPWVKLPKKPCNTIFPWLPWTNLHLPIFISAPWRRQDSLGRGKWINTHILFIFLHHKQLQALEHTFVQASTHSHTDVQHCSWYSQLQLRKPSSTEGNLLSRFHYRRLLRDWAQWENITFSIRKTFG